ncbi:MAG TPA: GAF domain-containing protein [Polyangiaceae bacterium]
MAKATQRKVLSSGSARLESVLDFVTFAAKPMPLLTLLDEAPKRIAEIVDAKVCSLYALEGGGELVMRGNVGFPRSAIGQVRLAVGEGLTGEAVEYMRPVVAELADKHASYKHFEELGEDRFPVFLAVPIRGKSGPVGAAVVQRAQLPFSEVEIELLVLLGALIAAGIRTAELLDAQREKAPVRKAGGGTRKVTLPGRPVVPGRALGAVAALRRPPQRPSVRIPGKAGAKAEAAADVRLMKSAFDVAEKAIRGLAMRAEELDIGNAAGFLGTYREILTDSRFRQRACEYAGDGRGIAQALSAVARDVTRTAVQMTRDPFMDERARDIEDLCDAISMLADSDKRAELPQRSILVGDALTVFDLLVSSRARPVGVALTERAGGPRSRILLELLGVPALMDVQGLFRWASDGDVALIDADHGLLMINPSKAEVAALREHRRRVGREEEE